jgi:hypothetical protein
MPTVKPDIFLVSQVVPAGGPDDLTPDAARARFAAHLTLARPFVERQQGVILREGGDRMLARFSDPVRAALCAVRIQQAHRDRSRGPAPPRVRVIVFGPATDGGAGFSGDSEDALAWSRPWLLATGAGEIVVSSSVAAAWREDGNRELKPRSFVTADGPDEGALLLWESHSHESARTVRQRGWLFVGLVTLPALLLFAYTLLHLPGDNPAPTGNTLLWGPFWKDAAPLDCTAPARPGWHVLADPGLRGAGVPRDPGAYLLRATGTVERGEGPPSAVLDVFDSLSGRHVGRQAAPCGEDPCACFSRLAGEVLSRTPAAGDPVVRDVCVRLLSVDPNPGNARQAAIDRCVTSGAWSGDLP